MSSWVVDAIKNAVPVTQVAGVANNHYAYCPDSSCDSRKGRDKKARVRDDHFKCFRCGAWGNVFDWVMLEDDCSYPAARAKLAALAGISLKPNPERSDLMRKVVRAANQHLLENLDKYTYLTEVRGLSKTTLFREQVGYIDPEGEALRASGLTGKQLLQLGFLTRPWRGEVLYRSYFAGRFIFPIKDQRREPVQIKGRKNPDRCVDTDASDFERQYWAEAPKALCFPSLVPDAPEDWGQSNVWDTLYGEECLWDARRAGYLFLCEGEIDRLTLTQWGLHAVGLPGNQGLERHYRKFDGIKVVYDIRDNDEATEKLMPEQLFNMQLAAPDTKVFRVRIPELAGPGLKVDVNDYHAVYGKTLADLRELVKAAAPVHEVVAAKWGPLFEQEASMAKLRRFYQVMQGKRREAFFKSLCTWFPHMPAEYLRFALDPSSLRKAAND